jgi:ADP-dependent NAD(P)H-hydrate dehydratase / NAD(P)H-hydrate epimerase
MRVLTSVEMAAVDRAARRKAGVPGLLLMEHAAAGCVALLSERFPGWRRVAVVCGPGNNGGDGLAIARLAAAEGLEPQVFSLAAPERFLGDARENARAWIGRGGRIRRLAGARSFEDLEQALGRCDGVIDALFGTGLSRPLSGPAARLVRRINGSARPILSVDVPSGLSGDATSPSGPVIGATVTAAIAAPKICHVVAPAREFCGEVVVVDIGIPEELIEIPRHRVHLVGSDAVARALPRRPDDSHKGDFGHVAVVAGSIGKAGAAVLAARAALRGGAGLVTVLVPESIEPRITPALPEAMTLPLAEEHGALAAEAADEALAFLAGCDAIVLGPGLSTSESARRAVRRIVLSSTAPLVLDADGLNNFAGDLRALARRRGPIVLTPHPGEAARLLRTRSRLIQADRIAAVREIARRARAVAVLKGAGTLVASADGEVFVNPTGGPVLATAGSGDVLSGLLGALLAGPFEAIDAAVCGVFLHGAAGDRVAQARGDRGAMASDFAEALPEVMKDLESEVDG